MRDGNREIYVMERDGSKPTRITIDSARDDDPMWSPDSKSIAFVSERDGNRENYLVAATGGEPRRLTNDPAEDDVITWSPDGTRIAFRAHRKDGRGKSDVEVVDVRTRHRTNLTDYPNYDGSVDWSPDGRMLAFISSRDGYNALYVMGADGSNLRRLTATETLDPRWGPRD